MSTSAYRSVFRPALFSGRVVLVTGAGSGIGRCCAHELAALGASLALLGRNADKLAAVANELGPTGVAVSTHPADIRDAQAVQAAVGAALERHGRIDGLVNNAGGQFPAPAETITPGGWEAVLATNLTGGFFVAREVYLQSMKAHGGAIVNMLADIWNGMPGIAHWGAARAGMLSFTESAACEWASAGVRVNAVAPGWIASSGLDTYDDALKAQLRHLQTVVPVRRFGTASEVSAAIVFLLSQAASFITGSCIRIDGGVPNARHTWPARAQRQAGATAEFDGFHLASRSRMLDE